MKQELSYVECFVALFAPASYVKGLWFQFTNYYKIQSFLDPLAAAISR